MGTFDREPFLYFRLTILPAGPPACPACPGDQLLPAHKESPALHPEGGQGGRPGQGQGKEQLTNFKVSAKLQTELYQSTE